MKKLDQYIKALEIKRRIGDFNHLINGIAFDSRLAGPGVIFVATRGTRVDGHNYIEMAIKAGTKVVVCENIPEVQYPGTVFLQVADSAVALGLLAAVYYDFPVKKIKIIGVTGTNGKTTVATLLYELALKMGYKAGLCSTVAIYINKNKFEATHTTPDALTLQKLIREMVDNGCDYCFMEVSSHAVDQKRINGLDFTGAIFTNITHDHLDYHKTFEAYLKAKKTFFDGLGKNAFALVNTDDKNGMVMVQNCQAMKKTFSLREMADFRARIIESIFDGMQLEINGKELWTSFIGRFNAANLLAVYGAASMLGWDNDLILIELSKLTPVDGRFETIRSSTGVTAVVDYAHTPDAIKNVLEAINQIRKPGNQLITVVGAGGDRDPFKRPLMASEAVKGSNRVILTSDNPRSEDPDIIISQMMDGVEFKEKIKVLAITNRREAIRTACTLANKGDIILVAGKGHETYQEIKGTKHYFDDREIIREFFDQH